MMILTDNAVVNSGTRRSPRFSSAAAERHFRAVHADQLRMQLPAGLLPQLFPPPAPRRAAYDPVAVDSYGDRAADVAVDTPVTAVRLVGVYVGPARCTPGEFADELEPDVIPARELDDPDA